MREGLETLPSIQGGMSSREIAEITGKEHSHVRRDCQVMFLQLGMATEGYVQNWIHPQNGQTYEEFILPKNLCLTLVSGYSTPLRKRIIDRWEELERQARDSTWPVPQTFHEALQLAADQARQLFEVSQQLEAAKPAVEFVDRYVGARGTFNIRQVAQILQIPERTFIANLLDDRILYRPHPSGDLMPYQRHISEGRFVSKTGEAHGQAFYQTRFTPKGLEWITAKYKGKNHENEKEVLQQN